MKRIIGKSFLILAAGTRGLAALSACSGGKENDDHTLNIVCLNQGYGREWIDELVKIWEQEHEGYKVHLEAESDASAIIRKNILSKNNVDDLYISNSKEWKTYALKGKLLELAVKGRDCISGGMYCREPINPIPGGGVEIEDSLDVFINAPYTGNGFSPEAERDYQQRKLNNMQKKINATDNLNRDDIRDMKGIDSQKKK